MLPLLQIVVASSNEGKITELRALLGDLPVQLVTTAEALGDKLAVAEDGETFEANAVIKARAVASATRMLALADDSGLEVDALGGRPGVRSARFAHDRATDAENNAALLRALEEAPADHERKARFRCVLALASPWWGDRVRVAEGKVEGLIARDPRGSGGFGYDPLFLACEADGRSMAELGEDEKNAISHRARAVRALRPVLVELINGQLDESERIAG
jgi:XTP/dITP diphosphohydrolase